MAQNLIAIQHPRSHLRSNQGVALVVVLSLIVIVVGIVMAYFSQTALQRQVSKASASQSAASAFAQMAVNVTIDDLKQEIVTFSTGTTSGSLSIYVPTSRGYVLPSAVLPSGDNPLSLLKESLTTKAFYTGGPARASAISSTSSSLNQHTISLARWNQPLLMPPTSATDFTPTTTFTPPDWIYVTRNGQNPTSSSTNARTATASNQDFVVGRYAYMIYDESALLDMNAAGYPSASSSNALTSLQAGRKGSLALADLTQIGAAAADVDKIVNWRNYITASSATSYLNYLSGTATQSGFLSIGSTTVNSGATDRLFTGRQELLAFLKSQGLTNWQNLAQYLGTFTREVNAPSWMPTTPSGSSVDYADLALQTSSTNRNVVSVGVTTSFVRKTDGSVAQVGEPLIKYRFPLRWLDWFNYANQSAQSSQILRWFCMQKRSDGTWDYTDPDSGSVVTGVPTIKNLDAVRNANREPTYWELLQAAILKGSLASGAANLTPTVTSGFTTDTDANATRQLLQIGLNIIDQYNSNAAPTVLSLNATSITNDVTNTVPICGIKNIPYMMFYSIRGFEDQQRTYPGDATKNYFLIDQPFFMWNPHQNATTATSTAFRIVANGESWVKITGTAGGFNGSTTPMTHSDNTLGFQTTSSRMFTSPTLILPSDATSDTSDYAKFPPGSSSPLEMGFILGQGGATKGSLPNTVQNFYNQPMSFVLKMSDGSHWIPCQTIPRYSTTLNNNGTRWTQVTTSVNNSGNFISPYFMYHSDPRTMRFGVQSTGAGTALTDFILTPNNWNIVKSDGSTVFPADSTYGPADLAYNLSTKTTYFTSPDSIVRPADGNLNLTATAGNPYMPNDQSSANTSPSPARPVFLGRAFNSVAELGYAFRDEPWKTLDFYSSKSADAALLDFFSLAKSSVRGGVVNPNGASAPVLAALLSGASQDQTAALSGSNSELSGAAAQKLASAIRSYMGNSRASLTTPLINPADIPAMSESVLSSTNPLGSGNLPGELKRCQETIVRSLADTWNTRTWNLLIDIVAQTGRLPANTSGLEQFTVNGECRLWVHVAIDRFTGLVVDMQVEPVFE
ncbi:MAG: hypothetical protein ACFUZC_04305 [Chthoniobacteraceae bacterium]